MARRHSNTTDCSDQHCRFPTSVGASQPPFGGVLVLYGADPRLTVLHRQGAALAIGRVAAAPVPEGPEEVDNTALGHDDGDCFFVSRNVVGSPGV
jgi:hypothetical protein